MRMINGSAVRLGTIAFNIALAGLLGACAGNPPVPTVAVLPTSVPVTVTVPAPVDLTPGQTPATPAPTLVNTATLAPDQTETPTPDVTDMATDSPTAAVTETPAVTQETPPATPEVTEATLEATTASTSDATVATAAVTEAATPPENAPITAQLPAGTLLLARQNQPTALLPDGRIVDIPYERFDRQSAPNGKFGVRLVTVGTLIDLVIVDLNNVEGEPRTIPEAKGFYSPIVTWKPDSSGFTFYDFPPSEKVRLSRRALYYYDMATSKAELLVRDPSANDTVPSSIAFSPDGKALIYTLNSGDAEGIGDANSPVYLLNMDTRDAQLLPVDAGRGFQAWLPDSSSFVASVQSDTVTRMTLYRVADLGNPIKLTPDGASDDGIAFAPGADQAVISTRAADGSTPELTLVQFGTDGAGERKPLVKLDDAQSLITGLLWDQNGIYYSTLNADPGKADTTFQVQADGSGTKEITDGTIRAVIGQ